LRRLDGSTREEDAVLAAFKAIVFDFDGLILDTETAEYRSFNDLYRRHGAELTIETWGRWIGTDASAFDPYAYLAESAGIELDREEARAYRRARYDELMAGERARPGVKDYLRAGRRLGLGIGLASSSPRAWVEGYLRQLGLESWFDCIRTRDDVAKVKPDPELYLKVVEALGVAPEEAVAFEDSPNGALAAKRAGLKCVVVPNELTGGLAFGEYDLRLSSMADMPLEEVLGRLS
jgi:HAD superfamily hydrolase (TIGR01509 family)